MKNYWSLLRRSMRISGTILAVDLAIALSASFVDLSSSAVLGDILILEAAALFLAGALLDVSSSVAMTQFRKVILHSKEEFSADKRRKAERRTIVFFLAGSMLFTAVILLALLDLLLQPPNV